MGKRWRIMYVCNVAYMCCIGAGGLWRTFECVRCGTLVTYGRIVECRRRQFRNGSYISK